MIKHSLEQSDWSETLKFGINAVKRGQQQAHAQSSREHAVDYSKQ